MSLKSFEGLRSDLKEDGLEASGWLLKIVDHLMMIEDKRESYIYLLLSLQATAYGEEILFSRKNGQMRGVV